ncbi:MAG: hypothetical protein ABUK13_01445 [Gammaproteobacteria bacterium]
MPQDISGLQRTYVFHMFIRLLPVRNRVKLKVCDMTHVSKSLDVHQVIRYACGVSSQASGKLPW